MAYQPGIPTGSVPLNQDYLNIQGNFGSLNTQWLVDHVPLTTAPGPSIGYHLAIHMVPVSTTVTNPPNNQPVVASPTTAGFGQLFSAQINDGINTDQALYYLSGGGRLTQMSRNIQPVLAAKGVTFLPGGLLFQWGSGSSGVAVTFAQQFSVAIFTPRVTVTPVGAAGSTTTPPVITSGPDGVGFTVKNSDNEAFTFHWMAIGL